MNEGVIGNSKLFKEEVRKIEISSWSRNNTGRLAVGRDDVRET